ncbi:MAG: hypothetical protein D6780_07570 [Candidatus Dadabacteria bacterium]|nr:MAG: hypothetical protein D6780_07570 [Candidatus Dadabacteria bacterium]
METGEKESSIVTRLQELNIPFKVGDRVKKIRSRGCLGTVKEIREEATLTSTDKEERVKALMIAVEWDNGTYSYFTPEGLEKVD